MAPAHRLPVADIDDELLDQELDEERYEQERLRKQTLSRRYRSPARRRRSNAANAGIHRRRNKRHQ